MTIVRELRGASTSYRTTCQKEVLPDDRVLRLWGIFNERSFLVLLVWLHQQDVVARRPLRRNRSADDQMIRSFFMILNRPGQ